MVYIVGLLKVTDFFSPLQRAKKRVRVNNVATKLLGQLPAKGVIDLSYLLENNKRQRKKTAAFTSWDWLIGWNGHLTLKEMEGHM